MAHELKQDEQGYQFVEVRGEAPAWHGLGEVVEQGVLLNATAAAQRVRAIYPVTKEPLFVQSGKQFVQLEDVYGIYREFGTSNQMFFGTCTKEYEIVSVADLLPYIDPITEKWSVETAGVLRDGKFFFLVCKTGEADVKGERLARYFFILIPYEPGKSIQVTATDVRVVCMNTCVMALEHNQFSIPVSHTKGATERFKLVMDFTKQLQVAQDEQLKAMELLANYKLQGNDFKKIAWATYPDPKPSKLLKAMEQFGTDENLVQAAQALETSTANLSYFTGRQGKMRQQLENAYERINNEYPDISETGWAAYNAITGRENWRKGKGETGAAESIMLDGGARNKIMKDGFTACYSLAKGDAIPLKQMKYMPELS